MSYQITTIPKFDKQAIYFNVFAQRKDSDEIVLLSIYDKSEHKSITDKQIREALKSVRLE